MTERFKKVIEFWYCDAYKSMYSMMSHIDNYIKDETTIDELGTDSLDEVLLVMDLEREYNIEITDEEVARMKLRTMPFKYLCEYVETKERNKYLKQ